MADDGFFVYHTEKVWFDDRSKTMKWERCDSVPGRLHNYRREDGWSIYLADGNLGLWKLCEPDGTEGAGPDLPVDPIDNVLAWADQVIAKFQGKG